MNEIIFNVDNIEKNSNDKIVINFDTIFTEAEFNALIKANEFLNKLEESIISEKPFLELFQFEDTSLWWFIHPSIISPLKRTISFIDKFEELIKKYQPTSIMLKQDFEKLSLIKQICDKKNIKINFSQSSILQYNIKHNFKQKFQHFRFNKIFSRKKNIRLQLFKKSKQNIPTLDGKILFAIATSYRRNIYDPETEKSIQGEYIQGSIIEILEKMNEEIICMDLDYSFRGDFEVLKQRLNDSLNWFPIEAIEKRTISNNHKNFIKRYKNILNNHEFHQVFTYKGIDFWKQIQETLWTLTYSSNLPFYIQIIESLSEFFEKNKPKSVFIPYETGPLALAIILSCEKNNVKTIGLQHGLILSSNADYSHKIFRSNSNLLGFPLPNKMLLFGDYAKRKLLEKSSYPEEKSLVFGNAAFFKLDIFIEKLQRKDLKEKFNIPKGKKIILFPTTKSQVHYTKFGRQNYDEQLLKKLLELYSNDENIFVILKPHPSGEYIESYKKMIKDFNSKNFIIEQGNLFEMAFVSDLVLAVYSNVLIDTITIGVPTISVNLTGKDFPFKNIDALLNCELHTLHTTINQVFNNTELQDKIKQNRVKFIKDQYNLPNPNVIEQLKDLINSTI